MKHSLVPDTRQKSRGCCTSSESNECDGHDGPCYSQCRAPKHLHHLSDPHREESKSSRKLKKLVQKCLLHPLRLPPKNTHPQRVASFSAGQNLILFLVLESSAPWLQYRQFSVINCVYMYSWDVDICFLN